MAKQYIMMAGTAGAAAALAKARECSAETEKHFSAWFLKSGKLLEAEEERLKETDRQAFSCSSVLGFEDGSVLNGLWKLGETLGCGLEADMDAIPLSQYTIEISEFFGLNPYEEKAGNGFLAVTDDPEEFLEKCKAAGITAAKIGYLTEGKARTALTAEGKRFLTPER